MSKAKTVQDYLIAGVLMSLAWSLRGQFGHLKGAMIPGAAAALIPLLLRRGRWLSSTGVALILSSLGFSLGGHMSYGRLFEFIEFSEISKCLPQIMKIFLIGGVWGGVGATFLGYGFSEKTFSRSDFMMISAVWIFWLITLGVMDLENYDVLILYLGFTALHLYNYRVKKSKIIFDFGFGGMLSFGTSFVFAILLLNLGRRGFLPGHWPWWGFRDQLIGFLGGLSLWGITVRCAENEIIPALGNDSVSLHKMGIIFFVIMIPAVNSMNVMMHWMRYRTVTHPDLFALFIVAASFSLMFFVFLNKWEIFSIHLERTLLAATLFFIWYMSLIAILKEWIIWGSRGFESGQILFLIFSAFLTYALTHKAKDEGLLRKL